MSRKPMPGSFLAPQQTFPTTEDAQASYGFAAPPLAGAAGEGEKPFDAERAQALRDDVRKKYNAALLRVLEPGRWFRIEAVLDEADAQAKELAALRARLAEETRAAAEAEREKLALHEELRGLRADELVKNSKRTNAAIITIAESIIETLKLTSKGRDKSATFWCGVLVDWCNSIEDAFWPESEAPASDGGPLLGDEGKEGREDA